MSADEFMGAGIVLLALAAGLYAWAVGQDRARWQLAGITLLAVVPAVLVAENFRQLI